MKFSAQLTLVLALIFAALCLGYAVYGWWSLSDMAPGQDYEDAKGFVWFWAFLGGIGALMAIVSWRMTKTTEE